MLTKNLDESGGVDLIEKLLNDEKLSANDKLKDGLNDMQLLFKYLRVFKIDDKVSFLFGTTRVIPDPVNSFHSIFRWLEGWTTILG